MRLLIIAVSFIISLHNGDARALVDSKPKGYYMLHPNLDSEPSTIDEKIDYNQTVLFYLYTRSVSAPVQLWMNDWQSITASDFAFTKKTVIISHGFVNDVNSDITQSIKKALLEFDDVNVIGVDWSYIADKLLLYPWVVTKVPLVGEFVGKMASYLVSEGLSPSNLHLIGHSLGAHVSGFAGKELQANGHMPGRITGLDPALPGFKGNDPSSRLASTDGQYVDCIHTCAGLLGFDVPICQADFYPNGGINIQPGCVWFDFGTCSHGRSFEYFASSINATNKFDTEICNAIENGIPYGCSSSDAQMGYFASPEFLGEFYLQTSSSYPFAMNVTAV